MTESTEITKLSLPHYFPEDCLREIISFWPHYKVSLVSKLFFDIWFNVTNEGFKRNLETCPETLKDSSNSRKFSKNSKTLKFWYS